MLHRYSWWATARGSLELRVHAGCGVCGAEAYGATRRGATRALLSYHIPGGPECRTYAVELDQQGDLQTEVLKQASAMRRAELDHAVRIAERTAHTLVWWRDCSCEGDHCGYGDGDCPMCQQLEGTGLACPRDQLYGVVYPAQGPDRGAR